MNKQNLISVIVPIYNVEKYLKQCLDSIINQTYKNLEIILIDDGSTDNCGKICDDYALKDNRIKVIHKQNGGLSSARNIGLDTAKGEYIGFIDSDDYIEKDMYENMHNTALKTNTKLVICNWFKGNTNKWDKNKNFPDKNILTTNEALEFFYNDMYVWNKLYKKDIVKKLRFIETFAQDVLYTFVAFKRAKIISCLNKHKCYYRTNPKSRQHTKKFRKDFLFFLKVLNIELEYAEINNLIKLQKKLYEFRLQLVTLWLSYIALEKIPDIESANILLTYLKGNIFILLKTKYHIKIKIFAVLVRINFNLARKIYKTLCSVLPNSLLQGL